MIPVHERPEVPAMDQQEVPVPTPVGFDWVGWLGLPPDGVATDACAAGAGDGQ